MEAAERQTLLDQLVHADEEMRRLAVERTSLLDAEEALGLLLARLADESWRVRKAAIERLAGLSATESVVAALLGGLADGENPGHRNAALEALVHCGRAAVPALLRALSDPDVDVRKQVVDVIAAIGDSRAADQLLALLADPDPNVRAAAADALARVGKGEHGAALLARFAGDPEPLVRLALLRALVALEVPVGQAALDPALSDPILRGAAYAALGASGDPDAAERIAKGMLSARESERDAAMEAAAALVARCAPERVDGVVRRLRELARSHSEVVRNACERLGEAPEARRLPLVQLLGVLRAPEAVLPLLRAGVSEPLADAAAAGLCALGDDWERTLQDVFATLAVSERAFACRVLERGGSPRAVKLLRGALGDDASEVREAAARGLARRAHLEALGDLIARLLGSEDAERVSGEELRELVAAVAAIAERGEGNGVDAALALVEARLMRGGERARLSAAQLLGRLARPSDGARVRALLSDPSPAVRRASVEAAPRLGEAAGELLGFALGDEATPVRVAAAAALARSTSPNADAELAALTEDREARVRAAAMGALGMRCARPESRAQGLQLLARGVEQEGVVALAALAALEALGGADAARAARGGLASPEAEIAERAAACLGLHGEGEELALLVPLLRHAAWSVRARAARELGERRVAAAFPHLFHRIDEEPDAFVRDALLRAVAALER